MTSRRLMLPVLLTGTFMGFLDLFLVIVAVPSIARELHAAVATTQLVLTIYVTAYGAALVVGGRLGDRYGRRRVYAYGMAAFTVTSLGCALAPDATTLIVVRGLQGVAGAAMLPQVLASIHAILSGEDRRRAVLLYTTALGAAGAFGQLIGGGLIALDVLGLGWRTLFLINVPIGIVALCLIRRAVPETTAPEPPPIDVAGAIVVAISLGLLLLGLGTGPSNGWPLASWLLVAGGLAAASTLPAIERRQSAPLLPAALLQERSVRWGLAATTAFYAANNVVFIGLTLFLQNGLGIGALGAGAAYLPLGVAYMASTLTGRRPNAPSGPTAIVLGSAIMAASLAITIPVALAGAAPVVLSLLLAVFGAGLGLVYPAIVATVLARVRPGEEGAATGVLLTTTQISNALGIAIATAAWTTTAGAVVHGRLGIELGVAGALCLVVAAAGARLGARAGSGAAHGRERRCQPVGPEPHSTGR